MPGRRRPARAARCHCPRRGAGREHSGRRRRIRGQARSRRRGRAPRNRAVPRPPVTAPSAGRRWPRASGIHAAGIVLAVPAWEAAALAPAELAAEAARWVQLEPSPVVSLHVVYGSRVTQAAVRRRGRLARALGGRQDHARRTVRGQYLAAAVPAADRYVDSARSQLRAELLPELERLFPAAAETEVQDFFVTRERRALIRQVPGAAQLRASSARCRGRGGRGRSVDRHGLAGHHGRRGPQRPCCGREAAG